MNSHTRSSEFTPHDNLPLAGSLLNGNHINIYIMSAPGGSVRRSQVTRLCHLARVTFFSVILIHAIPVSGYSILITATFITIGPYRKRTHTVGTQKYQIRRQIRRCAERSSRFGALIHPSCHQSELGAVKFLISANISIYVISSTRAHRYESSCKCYVET